MNLRNIAGILVVFMVACGGRQSGKSADSTESTARAYVVPSATEPAKVEAIGDFGGGSDATHAFIDTQGQDASLVVSGAVEHALLARGLKVSTDPNNAQLRVAVRETRFRVGAPQHWAPSNPRACFLAYDSNEAIEAERVSEDVYSRRKLAGCCTVKVFPAEIKVALAFEETASGNVLAVGTLTQTLGLPDLSVPVNAIHDGCAGDRSATLSDEALKAAIDAIFERIFVSR